MPLTWVVSEIQHIGDSVEGFGQLIASGNYPTANGTGDVITVDYKLADKTANWATYQKVPAIPATLKPLDGVVQLDAGYIGVISVVAAGGTGQGATLGVNIVIYSAAGTELSAGAYPVALSGSLLNTLKLRWKLNR